MANRTNVYEQVTNQIIEQLENGVPPWRRPWATIGGGMPSNVVSGKPYRGVNILLLWATSQAKGFDSNLWATFRQWKKLDGFVRKGEKGARIVFWNIVTEKATDPQTGEEQEEKRFFARQFTVFNLEQCGGAALDQFRTAQPMRDITDFAPAEDVLAGTGIEIRHGGNRAYYCPTDDYIGLPNKEAFDTDASYYSTAFHEQIHATGHSSRLNRLDKLARFGSESYAAEELVAELGSSFLTASLGIENSPIQNNASYLAGWLEVLRADNRAIFTASTAASAAADFILSFSNVETVDHVEDTAEIPF